MRSPKSHQLAIQKLGFSTLDPNDTYRTRLWCSERTQTLYRTLRGFSNYTRAIEILDRAERCETPEIDKFQGIEQYPRIADVSRRKFRLLVSMQLYAQFTSEQLTQVENILSYVPELVVSYYEQDFLVYFILACLILRAHFLRTAAGNQKCASNSVVIQFLVTGNLTIRT